MPSSISCRVAQHTVYDLREDVCQAGAAAFKIFRWAQPRHILSRVTNDVDTISATLQQSIPANQCGGNAGGHPGHDADHQPLLTLAAFIVIPLSFRHLLGGTRSQSILPASEGAGRVERARRRDVHRPVLVSIRAGKSGAAIQKSTKGFTRGAGRPSLFRGHYALDDVYQQPRLCWSAHARPPGNPRAIPIGDVQAFIQYAKQFNSPSSRQPTPHPAGTAAPAERVSSCWMKAKKSPTRTAWIHNPGKSGLRGCASAINRAKRSWKTSLSMFAATVAIGAPPGQAKRPWSTC